MSRILLNSISGGVYFFVSAVVTLFLTPVIVLNLGNRMYGSWEIVLSVYSYLTLLDLGINPAIVRQVARAAATNDRDGVRSIFTLSLILTAIGGFLGLVVLAIVGANPGFFLNLESTTTLRLVIWIMGLNLLIHFPGGVLVDVLMGLQRHYMVNGLRSFLAILQSVAIYWALKTQGQSGLVWLAGILTVSAGVQYAIMTGICHYSGIVPTRHGLSRSAIKELYAFGLKSMGLLAAARIQKQSIPILIGWLLGAPYVVFFSIPNRLIDYATDLVMQIGIPLTAHFSTLEARGDPNAMLDAWMRSSRFLQLIIYGLGIGILGLGEPFISLWLGPEYATGGRWVIRALGLSFLLDGIAPNSGRLLLAMARHGKAAASVLIISILGVPLTIWLGREFGFEGIAVAIFLTRSACVISVQRLAQGILNISLTGHLRHTLARFQVPILLYAGVIALGRKVVPLDSYLDLIILSATASLVYLGLSWRMALQDAEKVVLRDLGHRVMARLPSRGKRDPFKA